MQFCGAQKLQACADGEASLTRHGSQFNVKCQCNAPMVQISDVARIVDGKEQIEYFCTHVC
jgi:hypothetical protein